jgi:hypothetical protein
MRNIKKILMLLSLLIINSQTLSSKNWIANENGVTPTFYLVCVLVVIAFLGGLFIYIPLLRNYEKKHGSSEDSGLGGCGVIAFLVFCFLMFLGIAGQCSN